MAPRKLANFNENLEEDIGSSDGRITLVKNEISSDTSLKKMICRFPKRIHFPGFGIICAMFSALLFSVNALMIKLIRDLHPIQLGLARVVIQFLMLLPLVQYKRDKVDILGPEGLKRILWLRGFAGSSAMIFLYLSVNVLSIGDAITITYLSMILVPFIARIFLKEALTMFDIIFALISLSGVILIAQPSFLFSVPEEEQTDGLGVIYAIMCAMLQATSIVSIRKLGLETYPPLSVLYYSICGAMTTTIVLCAMQEFRFPCRDGLLYIFSLGILGLLGQWFLTLALQNERAGTVGVLRSIQIIMVYVLQATVLGDIPTVLSLIGAALVFSSSIGIGVRKLVNEGKRRKSIAKRNSLSKAQHSEITCETGI